MRALIQRVSRGSVSVDEKTVGSIGQGLVILLGVAVGDTDKDLNYLVDKCVNLRIFEDENGKMNRSLRDIEGEALIISQFTLYGDAAKGRRPSFTQAAKPDTAVPLYEEFIRLFRASGIKTEAGIFGADMTVNIINDGPVTLMLESPHNAQKTIEKICESLNNVPE